MASSIDQWKELSIWNFFKRNLNYKLKLDTPNETICHRASCEQSAPILPSYLEPTKSKLLITVLFILGLFFTVIFGGFKDTN